MTNSPDVSLHRDYLREEKLVKLWKYFIDCGRHGEIDGLFVATQEEIDSAIGRNVFFDEPLGKHSAIAGIIEPGEITLVTDDQHTIKTLEAITGKTICGYNPLDYITN